MKLEVGQRIQTNTGEIEVINIDRQNITVRYDDGYEVVALKGNVIKGSVKNPFAKTVYGVGYCGIGKYKMHGQLAYSKWRGILHRCYDEQYAIDHPTYTDVYCCDEWHNYQNFAEWAHRQIGFAVRGFDLDKDVLVRGNKVYSPETCVFVPQELNKILGNTGREKGISTRPDLNGKWIARHSTVDGEVYLGCYEREVALQVYREYKLKYLKERAVFWKDRIDERAFEALMEFSFID